MLQANVKEPELYELCDRVREIRQAIDSADDGHKAEMQQQLAEPQAASQWQQGISMKTCTWLQD